MPDIPVTQIRNDVANNLYRPLVTIVIVCYNQGRFLSDAISSALNQTYRNVEIIVVDDGSTDDTATNANRFSGVRYIHQKNSGLSAARNAGLRASRGQYIVFLDADDRLLPRAIRAGVDCFRQFPDSGFVFGGYRHIRGDGSYSSTERDPGIIGDFYRNLLRRNFIAMHAAVMYSREVLESAGGFNVELRAAEDYEVYLRITRRWKANRHGSVAAEYRTHGANMTGNGLHMLKSTQRVLDLERAHVRDRTDLRALRSGMNFFREYYGRSLIVRWREHMTIAGFFTIMRWYPEGLLRRTAKSMRNRLFPVSGPRKVNFGDLRRWSPFSRQFGFDRGQPVDRVYIESFLSSFAVDIHGRVLEIGDDYYSRTFGGDRVATQDVLHITQGHPGATITADLANAPHIPSDSFDCIVFTQTLHLIYDLKGALATLHRILKPGGVLLATVPGISQVCRDAAYPEADSWRFTESSATRLFTEFFEETNVRIQTYGNVLTATAFLYGLAAHELKTTALEYHDADYPVIIGIRAQKEEPAE